MKAILIIQLISLLAINCYAQSDIVSNGDETESKILITGNIIPKNNIAFQDCFTINNKLNDFSNMVFENGRLGIYSEYNTAKLGKSRWNARGNYFSLGIGVGNS